MPLVYEITQERTRQGSRNVVEVTGYTGRLRDLVVPNELEGLPVCRIAGHAFEHQKELRSVSLPESLKTLRAFAFYGCSALASVELFNTTDDYYDGVIRQCPSLRRITVHCVRPQDYVIVREMLRDVDGTLSFRLLTQEGEIRLTFPEYVNEAQEDTMARAIHFSIEGAGMAYRECVGRRALDLPAYDSLLGRLTDYDFDVAARIALGRLACPVCLAQRYEKGYEEFLRSNDEKALRSIIEDKGAAGASPDGENERRENLQVLLSRGLVGSQALAAGLESASRQEDTRICSMLMEYRRRTGGSAAPVFSLEW